jgi:betaine reductase
VTEPAGSGNVPLLNYRVIAGLAALRKEIIPAEVAPFVSAHGMPGFSPTKVTSPQPSVWDMRLTA